MQFPFAPATAAWRQRRREVLPPYLLQIVARNCSKRQFIAAPSGAWQGTHRRLIQDPPSDRMRN